MDWRLRPLKHQIRQRRAGVAQARSQALASAGRIRIRISTAIRSGKAPVVGFLAGFATDQFQPVLKRLPGATARVLAARRRLLGHRALAAFIRRRI